MFVSRLGSGDTHVSPFDIRGVPLPTGLKFDGSGIEFPA